MIGRRRRGICVRRWNAVCRASSSIDLTLEASSGSKKLAQLFKLLNVIALMAEQRTGQRLDDDDTTLELTVRAAEKFLRNQSASERYLPDADPSQREDIGATVD